MAVTMEQVAKMAGTSRPTVSDVLRGRWKEKGISQKTYERVMEAARKMNYRPNRLARSLVRRKTQLIGVQLASFQYEYGMSMVKGLDAAARRHGYHILLAAPAAWQQEAQELSRLYEHQVDGLILAPQVPAEMESAFEQLESANVPIVFLIGTLPITPGGLGTTNAAMVELLSPYLSGSIFANNQVSPKELLFAATLLWMFANYMMKIITGVILMRGVSRDLFRPTDEVPEETAEHDASHMGGNI